MSKMKEEKKLRIPYVSPGLASQAIDLFRRMSPKKINSKFIVDNNLATASNAFKIVDLLLWFGIIDREGGVNEEIARKLKLYGKDKDEFMKDIIKKSYLDLFEALDLMQVSRNDIINFIINHYEFGAAQAKYAAVLFLHFCQTYEIPIAEELKKKTYKFSERERKPRKQKKEFNKSRIKKQPLQTIPELNDNQIAVILIAPGVNYSFYAKNGEEFEGIVKAKLPIAVEGVRNAVKLIELENQEENKDEN